MLSRQGRSMCGIRCLFIYQLKVPTTRISTAGIGPAPNFIAAGQALQCGAGSKAWSIGTSLYQSQMIGPDILTPFFLAHNSD